MQKNIYLAILAAFLFALCGCVNRTVSSGEQNRGSSAHGSKSSSKVISEKRVWIWQKEFRNN
ncbi:hypothetical protein P4C99_12870 [Pontiellaceae bacterium B1224]|nr:hypothetical protein [Pontiellaceae bacterium B1224]